MTSTEDFWRILLVEDDEDDYLIVRELLREIKGDQFDLHWVMHNGVTVELACSGRFDVCLIDHHLGAITGFDFLDQIKASCKRAPVALMTGFLMPGVLETALQRGAYAVLDKERITPRILESTVQEVIRLYRNDQ